MALTDVICRSAKAKEKSYRLSDEKGLYPEISLKEAREKRDDARKLLANNLDSSEVKKSQKLHGDTENTFFMAFEAMGLSSYYNAHSFRKMLVLWAMENCSQYQVKALSQSLGHEHCMTTYNSYGTLNITDQRKAMLSINMNSNNLHNTSTEELMAEIKRRVKQ